MQHARSASALFLLLPLEYCLFPASLLYLYCVWHNTVKFWCLHPLSKLHAGERVSHLAYKHSALASCKAYQIPEY